MKVIATARKQPSKPRHVKEKVKGKVINPGKLDVRCDLELLREPAEALNPNYQISCILSKLS